MPVWELLYTNTIFGRFYLSQEEALHLRENKINLNIWVDYWKHSLSGREILNYEMASSGKSQESLSKILKIKSDKTLAGPNVGNDPVLVWGREAEKPFGAFLLFILKILPRSKTHTAEGPKLLLKSQVLRGSEHALGCVLTVLD